jgi:hypothetical protein
MPGSYAFSCDSEEVSREQIEKVLPFLTGRDAYSAFYVEMRVRRAITIGMITRRKSASFSRGWPSRSSASFIRSRTFSQCGGEDGEIVLCLQWCWK